MRFSFGEMFGWILSRPLTVIFVIAAVTFFFAWQLPDLSFKTSIYDLQIEDLPETVQYDNFKNLFGSDEIIRVVIKCNNVFDSITFRKVEQLAETAAAIEGVRRVISLPGVKKAIDVSGNWGMEKFSTVVLPVDLFRKNLISTDRKTTALTLVLENDADPDKVIRRVRQLLIDGSSDLMLYQIGMPLVSEALAYFTQKDFFRLILFKLQTDCHIRRYDGDHIVGGAGRGSDSAAFVNTARRAGDLVGPGAIKARQRAADGYSAL